MSNREPKIHSTISLLQEVGYQIEPNDDGSVTMGELHFSEDEIDRLSPAGLADLADYVGIPRVHRPGLGEKFEDAFFNAVGRLLGN